MKPREVLHLWEGWVEITARLTSLLDTTALFTNVFFLSSGLNQALASFLSYSNEVLGMM